MEVEYVLYLPENVIECLTMGNNSFIGLVDDTTVLKYPLMRSDKKALAVLDLESRILELIGPHKHIIGFKGLTDDGLLLERAPFGSIAVYLESNDPVLKQRLNWAYQATEALTAVHKMHVLHRDISANNFLLDAGLNLKLSDFQGRVLAPNGDVVEDGLSIESTKSSMPRGDSDHADWRTDIFALGSAFYYIMEGHEPYPDLDPYRDEEQIVERFTSGQFPEIGCSSMNRVIHKCWTAEFDSAEAVLYDLGFVHQRPTAGAPEETIR